jgi:anti-anti-sigma regulatory factor
LAETLAALSGAAIIDLAGVRYVDSSALSEFAIYAKRILPARAVLTGLDPQVLRIFQIVRFESLFVLEPKRPAVP